MKRKWGTVSLPKEMVEKIYTRLGDLDYVSVSEFVRAAVKEFLKNHPEAEG
jgi:Arc/MetJ-type ribon-helix-helix transcriptional regulator